MGDYIRSLFTAPTGKSFSEPFVPFGPFKFHAFPECFSEVASREFGWGFRGMGCATDCRILGLGRGT
jgi:hypothetical protein